MFSGDLGYYLAATVVYALVGAVCVYTLFLMALARVALAVLLAIGPVFIVLLLFDGTKRFFEGWIAQLANYALVGVLAVLTASLLMTVVEAYATQTAAKGAAILTVDALDMLLVAGLILLVLRQVMPMAARLAGGLSLASYGVMRRAFGRAASVTAVGSGRLGQSMLARAAIGYDEWRSASLARSVGRVAAGRADEGHAAVARRREEDEVTARRGGWRVVVGALAWLALAASRVAAAARDGCRSARARQCRSMHRRSRPDASSGTGEADEPASGG